jgi:hypothetical protein
MISISNSPARAASAATSLSWTWSLLHIKWPQKPSPKPPPSMEKTRRPPSKSRSQREEPTQRPMSGTFHHFPNHPSDVLSAEGVPENRHEREVIEYDATDVGGAANGIPPSRVDNGHLYQSKNASESEMDIEETHTDAPQLTQASSPSSIQPKCAAHTPARGINPHNTGSPPGPQKRYIGHANVARAKAARDTEAHARTPARSKAITHATEWKVAHEDGTRAFERMGIPEVDLHPRGQREGHKKRNTARSAPPASKGPTSTALLHQLQRPSNPARNLAVASAVERVHEVLHRAREENHKPLQSREHKPAGKRATHVPVYQTSTAPVHTDTASPQGSQHIQKDASLPAQARAVRVEGASWRRSNPTLHQRHRVTASVIGTTGVRQIMPIRASGASGLHQASAKHYCTVLSPLPVAANSFLLDLACTRMQRCCSVDNVHTFTNDGPFSIPFVLILHPLFRPLIRYTRAPSSSTEEAN